MRLVARKALVEHPDLDRRFGSGARPSAAAGAHGVDLASALADREWCKGRPAGCDDLHRSSARASQRLLQRAQRLSRASDEADPFPVGGD